MSGQITAIQVQKRNKERVNVYLDGEFAFALNLLDAVQLHKGQSLTPAEIADLKARDTVEQAVEKAVRFLANRPRSIAEVRQNLRGKDIDDPVIDTVIARLERLGYVDDVAFARYWVDNRERFNPRGARALRYELRQKGIANAIIDTVVSDIDATESARLAAEKKLYSLRRLEPEAIRTKLSSYLQRRGFDYETIRQVVDEVLADDFDQLDE